MTTAPDYRAFDLSGPHYAVGLALGAASEVFSLPAWWPPPPDLTFARECEAIIADFHRPIVDELRGYAEAQRMPYPDLLRAICRRTMRLRALPSSERPNAEPGQPRSRFPEGGCTSVALLAPGGHVLVGRNYDFHPVQRIRQRIRLSPERGLPSLGTRGSVPGGRYDGVNSAGLFACLHVVLADAPDQPRPGVPFHLVPRLILETCRSVREALDLIVRLPHLHPFNYTLADASGALASVEAHPARVRALDPDLTPAGRPVVAAANHYRHPEMQPYQCGRRLEHSIRRRGALASLVSVAGLDSLASALSDHASGVCGHSGGHTTLWSLLADLTARVVKYAAGAPCVAQFEQLAWPGTGTVA